MASPDSRISPIAIPTRRDLEFAPINTKGPDLYSKPDVDPFKTTIVSEISTQLTEGSMILAEEVQKLSPHLQPLAICHLHDPHSLSITPEQYQIMRISFKRENLPVVQTALNRLGLSLNTDHGAIMNDQDDIVTIQELIPSHINALLVYQALTDLNIESKVTTTIDPKGHLVLRIGSTFIACNPTLYRETLDVPKPGKVAAHRQSLTIGTRDNDPVTSYSLDGFLPTTAKKFGPDLNTSTRTINSLKEEEKKPNEKETNATGSVSYLVINPHIILQGSNFGFPHIVHILNDIAAISRSDGFIVKKDSMDNIVIIALQERASGFLENFGLGIRKKTQGKAHLRFGKGTLSQSEEGLKMNDYLSTQELIQWSKLGEGENKADYIIDEETYEKQLRSRENTTSQLKVEKIPGTKYYRILDVVREATLRVGGGPRKLIGQQDVLEELREGTGPKSRTKLTIIKGKAGIGKSRILDELMKENPGAMILSIDPACEKLPGMALINIIEQLDAFAKSKIKDLAKADQYKALLAPLQQICSLSPGERLHLAQTKPHELVSKIIGAISAFEQIFGSFPIVLDDMHHIDAHSDEHIMKIMETVLRETQCRIIATMRPEDRFKSTKQTAMEANLGSSFGPKAVKTIWLQDEKTGTPKLNLQDPQTAADYVFYSLPEEKCLNSTTGERKTFTNDWHLMLANKIQTPWGFTSLINILLRNPDKFLTYGENEIGLTNAALEELQKINNQEDLIQHERNRIIKLEPKILSILRLVAMTGTPFTVRRLLEITAEETGKIGGEAIAIIDLLIKQDYLTKIVDNNGITTAYELSNETIGEAIKDSIPPQEKQKLVFKHYGRISADSNVPDEVKFSWLQAATETSTLRNKAHRKVWAAYTRKATTVLEKDHEGRQYAKGLAHASAILCNLDPKAKTAAAKLIQELQEHPIVLSGKSEEEQSTTEEMIILIKSALLTYIESGANLGQFARVHAAIDTLEAICTNTQDPENPKLLEAYKMGFRMASMEESQIRNAEKRVKMNSYFKKIQDSRGNYTPGDLLTIEMQHEARACDHGDEVSNISNIVAALEGWLQKYSLEKPEIQEIAKSDPKTYAKIKLLYQRYLFECTVRKPKTRQSIDDDGAVDPSLFNQKETKILINLRHELDAIRQARETNPLIFDPIDDVAFLELLAQTYDYCGEYERAAIGYGENWRISNQIGLSRQAARFAYQKMLALLMMATSKTKYPDETNTAETEPLPTNAFNRQKISQAITTCNEEGFPLIKNVDPNDKYHLLLHFGRIRAVSLLVQTYNQELITASANPNRAKEFKRIKDEMIPYLKDALEDFAYFNTPKMEGYFTKDPSGEFSYYILPSIAMILEFIETLNITDQDLQGTLIPELKDSEKPGYYLTSFPALTNISITRGITRIQDENFRHVDNSGQVERKFEGFRSLIELFREKRAEIATEFDRLIEAETTENGKTVKRNILKAKLKKLADPDELEAMLTATISSRHFPA